ncbi:hypothetical protein AX16_003226 [Volvariella volvacea WC 439]|nr:hypothetical protein AX16_003226 [Volvariella volvacea WC 439]
MRPTAILDVLSKCRHLESLSIYLTPLGGILPVDPSLRFSHTSLSVLDSTFERPVHGIRPLFQAVQFPSLVDLGLADIVDASGILGLVAAASPPPEYLSLFKFQVRPEEILQFLQQIPTITELRIQKCGCFAALISNMTLSSENTTRYLPALKELVVGEELGELAVTNDELMRFIESRWRVQVDGFSSIKSIKVHDQRDSTDIRERVLLLQSEGLECYLSDMDSLAHISLTPEAELASSHNLVIYGYRK